MRQIHVSFPESLQYLPQISPGQKGGLLRTHLTLVVTIMCWRFILRCACVDTTWCSAEGSRDAAKRVS